MVENVGLKRYKIICIILAVIVSLSGMCFGNNDEADSLFAYIPFEKADSYIETVPATIADAQVCTLEMLGVRSISAMQQLAGRYICQKREFKRSLDFLCLNSLSLREEKFFKSSERTHIYSKCLDELVANYIHNSDGKKRI